jgi:site-specific recombinase XerC
MELFKPTFKDRRTGETRFCRFWYAKVGGRRISTNCTDKRAALAKAQEIERQLQGGFDHDKVERSRRQAIAEVLLDFEQHQRDEGVTERTLGTLLPRLRRVVAECKVRTVGDLDAERLGRWLADQHQQGLMAAQTRKHYASHLRQLGRWLFSTKRLASDPLAELRTRLRVDSNRVRNRRALTPVEIDRLLAATEASTKSYMGMDGQRRSALYVLAASSGLRRDELASLSAASFDLDAVPPAVTVESKWTKNRRIAVLPLRSDVADRMRPVLANLKPSECLFDVQGKRTADLLTRDLVAAGIEPKVGDSVCDFHSLRVTFVTSLALAGVSLALAQKLARHSTPALTSSVYTRLGLGHLADAVERLTPMGRKPENEQKG